MKRPADVVRRLGAVQAQDYLGALWAVGLRMEPGAVEADVEAALADGSIVRTWPMRGTLHFVTAEDIRWMLALMTPRIVARNAARLKRDYGIDRDLVTRSTDLMINALQGGKRLTRDEAYAMLEANGVPAAKQRGLHLLWWISQEGHICFGPRQKKQQTFVLLDEWVPKSRVPDRDEALGELALRYFTGHGPATLHDFVWWSGLTVAEAKSAVEIAGTGLVREERSGTIFRSGVDSDFPHSSSVHLLPAFDEYTVGYTDRSAILEAEHARLAVTRNGILNPVVVVEGRCVGVWKRTLGKGAVVVAPVAFTEFGGDVVGGIEGAARRYGEFLGVEGVVSFEENINRESQRAQR